MKKYFLILVLVLFSLSYAESYIIGSFLFPLPEKYKDYSSNQGLRDAISAEDTGGLSTSGMWHNGIDFLCPEKTPVYAAKNGEVVCVYPGYLNGSKWKGHKVYGSCIIIKHYDGTITLYAHLSRTDVKEGDNVLRGEQIALSGGNPKYKTSGISTGSHLHFSIYMDIKKLLEL